MKILVSILSAAVLLTHSMSASATWMVNTIVKNDTGEEMAIQVGGDANTRPPHGPGIPNGGQYAGNVTFNFCTGHASDQSLNLWVCKGPVGCGPSDSNWIGAINVIRNCGHGGLLNYLAVVYVNATIISKGYKITYNTSESDSRIRLNDTGDYVPNAPDEDKAMTASFTITKERKSGS